jgi:tripartite-type tricarboxylate transporter receptor subunit TctC
MYRHNTGELESGDQMKNMPSVVSLIAAVCASLAFAGAASAQQAYPNRTIRIVSPYTAGGSSGNQARLLARKLNESWGQPVIVDDRPGGNTIIGSEVVAKAAPDGYTLLWQTSGHASNPHLFRTPYDAIKDFTPVATFSSTEQLLVLHPSVPADNLQQFIALAKSKPGTLNYASSGIGGPPHLGAELFGNMTGVKIQHVPYKGISQATTDLIAGQVQLAFQSPVSAIQFVQSGKLKALAVSGDKRLSALPDVPTFAQAGLAGFDVRFWFGIFAPAGTPREVVDKLSAEVAKILAMPDVKSYLLGQGLEPFVSTSDQFAALLSAESAKYEKLIKSNNIKAE